MTREVSPEEYERMKTQGTVPGKRPGFRFPLIGMVIIGVSLLIGFTGGMAYQKHKTGNGGLEVSSRDNGLGAQNGMSGQSGFGGFGGTRQAGAFGTVTAISTSSIAIQDSRTGDEQTFTITDDTTISDNGASASVSDISKGDTVMIRGSSDDESTADSILLNAAMRGPGTMNAPTTTSDDAESTDSSTI